MAISIPPAVSVATSSVMVARVPAGASTVVLSNTGVGAAVIGVSTNVTASNGFPLPAGATVTIPGYPGSASTTLYAISATTATVGAIISTPQ